MLTANMLQTQCMVFLAYSCFAYLSFGQEMMTDPSATVSQYEEVVINAPAPFLCMIIVLMMYLGLLRNKE